jgi:predicted phosphodiesterase
MILAVISDVHANLEALEAVMSDIEHQNADKIICLGDIVGYGSDPEACLDLVDKNCAIKLMGNHEHAVMGKMINHHMNQAAQQSISWTLNKLADRYLPMIADLPIDAYSDGIYFVHSSPVEPSNWRYVLTSADAAQAFQSLKTRFCFLGHSHLPMIFSQFEDVIHRQTGHDFQPSDDTRYLINVGAVGQPRDGDSRASYVTYDTNEDDIYFHRVEYDIQKTQQKMRQANLPVMLIERLQAGI